MPTIELNGRINENGQLELDEPTDLPPGEVRIIIETVSPKEEAADEARWAASFAASQDALARMAEQALQDFDNGLTDELDPDTL